MSADRRPFINTFQRDLYRNSIVTVMATKSSHNGVSVIDIREDEVGKTIIDDLNLYIRPQPGTEKRLPTLLLYDEKGLKLFEEITYLDEYYLTNAEIEVFKEHADQIADHVVNGSQLIELGSGNLRKVKILLQAIEDAGKNIEYYALDLSLPELRRTLCAIPASTYKHVKFYGLHGSYDDGMQWLKQSKDTGSPRFVLWLGSSLGNYDPVEAASFLNRFIQSLNKGDEMLIGVDACQDPDKVFHAYNDRNGTTHKFIRNGLVHANQLLGEEAFEQKDWGVVGEYDVSAGRHQAFYVALVDVRLQGVSFHAGERVRIEESYKYSLMQSTQLWSKAGLKPVARFGNSLNDYHLHLLAVPPMPFPIKAIDYARDPTPSLQDFKDLWAAWDLVTRKMIPEQELLSKPIKLRNCCLFYLGHIPTFLDIHLTNATDGISTQPTFYRQIFERGIDPDVDNPEHCHAHSEIPDAWPPANEIINYQERVRTRLVSVYNTKEIKRNRKLCRALWIGFEHEAMHLETLLYMLVQSDKTLPPTSRTPDFEALAQDAKRQVVPNEWVQIPDATFTIGLVDPQNDTGPARYFGWDNETPARTVSVAAFQSKARPIANEDYVHYLMQSRSNKLPASWTTHTEDVNVANRAMDKEINGITPYMNGHSEPLSEAYLNNKAVKTVYGNVPLKYALDWPVMASFDELSGCATWMNGRIPTMEETRSIYNYVDQPKLKQAEKVLGKTISAVNGHLSNDGVEETPPSHSDLNGFLNNEQRPDPYQHFVDLEDCNVGFRHFHPTPITQNGTKLSGQGNFGGAWEWTSSVLEKHDGFEPMELYPAYTADFFDGKHNILLGGSWATHPRIAGRKTFVNWYQRNYPYVWAGARLVRDL